jgi:uncharacterized protein (DUF427 family)
MASAFWAGIGEVRWEPTEKRVRAVIGGQAIVDTTAARLVWEPRRIVPSYAVPESAISGELAPSALASESDRPVLDPGVPFSAHTSEGEGLDLRIGETTLEGAAFRPAAPDLAGYVILDFRSFEEWYDEDEPLVAHPRDPFKRIDALRSSRHVRIEDDGMVLAESSRPVLLFETHLPTRVYIPREDLIAEPLDSDRRTYCAYKGEAEYFSFAVEGAILRDIAWIYRDPLLDAQPVKDMVAFFNEGVDVIIDGERRERPVTPFSREFREETV